MKPDQVAMLLTRTHDLSCALDELGSAALRYALPKVLSSDRSVTGDLAVAAVAFSIQLAIDATSRDPAELRALERELLSKLGAVS